MEVVRGSISSAVEAATPDGKEAIALVKADQSPANPTDRRDTPLSHLRNALQVIELAASFRDGPAPCTDYGIEFSLTSDQVAAVYARITAAIGQLEAADKAPEQPSPLPVRLLPFCPPNVRKRLMATSALGQNPQSGAECIQLTIVCPPLVAGAHEYFVALHAVAKDLLEAIVKDRVDLLDEDSAQVRRVQSVLESNGDALRQDLEEMNATNRQLEDLRLLQEGPAELRDVDREALMTPSVSGDRVVVRIAIELVRAHRAGVDIGDVLAQACRAAAREVGDDLTAHRPGSWEAEHVRGLSGGWDL